MLRRHRPSFRRRLAGTATVGAACIAAAVTNAAVITIFTRFASLPCFTLTSAVDNVELARFPRATHAPKTFEFLPAERVQSFVPGRVLHEARLVTEPVVAVLPHAVEVRLEEGPGSVQW